MKRIVSIGLATVLLLSMTACTGGSSNLPSTLHTSEPASASTEELITVPTTVPTTLVAKATTTPVTISAKVPTTATTAPTSPAKTSTTTAPTKCDHSNAEWVVDKAATCIAKGKKQKICTGCETVLESAVIDETEHSYTNYKCTVCGKFQEGGISRYLSDWVQENGTVHGDTISLDFYIDDVLYGFTYNASGNYFYFSLLDENYNDFLSMKFTETAGIYDLAYIQGTEPNTREVYAKIEASKFTENTPITVEKYLGNSDERTGAVENCRICTGLLLESIETALEKYNVGLTLNDLGFSKFK